MDDLDTIKSVIRFQTRSQETYNQDGQEGSLVQVLQSGGAEEQILPFT